MFVCFFTRIMARYPFGAALLLLLPLAAGLDNGVGIKPPMGWLSWERYMCNVDCKSSPDSCISERLYMAQADRLVEDGYRDAGYIYVNIDVSHSLCVSYVFSYC